MHGNGSFRREAEETVRIGALAWIIGVMALAFVIVAVVLMSGVNLAFLPFVRQQESVINRSSQGYVEAKQMLLLSLVQDGSRLEGEILDGRAKGQDTRAAEAALNATLDRMQAEATLLGPQDVPAPAAAMLRRYGRRI